MHVQQRVLTPLGLGTVVGFERFSPQGGSIEPSVVDVPNSSARVIVKLDHASRWVGGTSEFPHPYCFRKDAKPVTMVQLRHLSPPAQEGGMSDGLVLRCRSCDGLRQYGLARAEGWSFDAEGEPMQAYYCGRCTAEISQELGVQPLPAYDLPPEV